MLFVFALFCLLLSQKFAIQLFFVCFFFSLCDSFLIIFLSLHTLSKIASFPRKPPLFCPNLFASYIQQGEGEAEEAVAAAQREEEVASDGVTPSGRLWRMTSESLVLLLSVENGI